jgi:hypothetical protein
MAPVSRRRRTSASLAIARAISDLSSEQAGQVIDATGLIVAPGFIDVQGQSGATLSPTAAAIICARHHHGNHRRRRVAHILDTGRRRWRVVGAVQLAFDGRVFQLRQAPQRGTTNVSKCPATTVRRTVIGMNNPTVTTRAHGSDGRPGMRDGAFGLSKP